MDVWTSTESDAGRLSVLIYSASNWEGLPPSPTSTIVAFDLGFIFPSDNLDGSGLYEPINSDSFTSHSKVLSSKSFRLLKSTFTEVANLSR